MCFLSSQPSIYFSLLLKWVAICKTKLWPFGILYAHIPPPPLFLSYRHNCSGISVKWFTKFNFFQFHKFIASYCDGSTLAAANNLSFVATSTTVSLMNWFANYNTLASALSPVTTCSTSYLCCADSSLAFLSRSLRFCSLSFSLSTCGDCLKTCRVSCLPTW